ncbi:MAG: MATE family efflux transporter [Eubacterium sp.]
MWEIVYEKDKNFDRRDSLEADIVLFCSDFFGNVFQLFYSLIDTKIVGSTLGAQALAAVGSVSTLHTLMTGFFNGLTLGFSILTAMHFGSGNREKLRKTFASSILLGLLISVALTAVVVVFLKPLLHLLNVPQAEYEMAYFYILILFLGLFVTMLYNACANTLRAIGDALTPLMFLILASVSNIALDYLFILVFHMGVSGAAVATVLAQSYLLSSVFYGFTENFQSYMWKKQIFGWRKIWLWKCSRVVCPWG